MIVSILYSGVSVLYSGVSVLYSGVSVCFSAATYVSWAALVRLLCKLPVGADSTGRQMSR